MLYYINVEVLYIVQSITTRLLTGLLQQSVVMVSFLLLLLFHG